MGERANGVTPGDGEPGSSTRVASEITTLRQELGDLVEELDRRRREALDVRLQLRRHPVAVSLVAVGVAALLGGAVAALVHQARRRQRPSYKARQLGVAWRRVMRHPERVARGEPPPSEKIAVAIATTAATLLLKRALERAVPKPSAAASRGAEQQRGQAGQER